MSRVSRRVGGTGTAQSIPRRRFLTLSNITALPDKSMLSDVRAGASLIRQPVSCRTVHDVLNGSIGRRR
jgi:hypothetical protein